MSLATLEKDLARLVSIVIDNPKFKRSDILAWQCGNDLKAEPGETVVHIGLGYNTDVAFKSELDKRKK